jgi:hypothetical protein
MRWVGVGSIGSRGGTWAPISSHVAGVVRVSLLWMTFHPWVCIWSRGFHRLAHIGMMAAVSVELLLFRVLCLGSSQS